MRSFRASENKMRYSLIRKIKNALIYVIVLSMVSGISANGIMAQDGGGEALFPIIENNVICGNTAGDGGGIACYNSSPIIRNNLIVENVATGKYGGGAIYVLGPSSNPVVTGNTVSGNKASYGKGGGIYVEEGQATIVNSILWENQDDLWNCTATYSDVTDLTADPGAGNISADPAFIQTSVPEAPGYYRLATNSPCINAGDPSYVPDIGETDIGGEPRITNGRIDIGADEAPPAPAPAAATAAEGSAGPAGRRHPRPRG